MASAVDVWPMQLDFAHVCGTCFVGYGWVAGLGSHVARAQLKVGPRQCNLLTEALLVPRRDVSEYLGANHPAVEGAGIGGPQHEHGFFVLFDWEADPDAAVPESSHVRLFIQTWSGIAQEMESPVVHGADAAAEALRLHEGALRLLIGRQSPRQVHLLTQLFQPPLVLRAGDLHGSTVAFGPALQVPIAGLVQGRLILAGQLTSPAASFLSLTARWHFRHGDAPRSVEVDVLPLIQELPNSGHWEARNDSEAIPADPRIFIATVPCPDEVIGSELELLHKAPSGAGRQRLTQRGNPQDVQRRLSAWLQRLEPRNRIAACEHVLDSVAPGETSADWRDALVAEIDACVPVLSLSLESGSGPDLVSLFLEQALLVPGVGVLLIGWAYADGLQPMQVTFHTQGRTHPVSSRWVRRQRVDVQKHLADQGFGQVDEPGFVCLVELDQPLPPLRPAYLKVVVGARQFLVRVEAPNGAEPVRRLIRTLLTAVDPRCTELRRLLDDHIGRAVQATWNRRPGPRTPAQRWQFGRAPAQPTVSIVIPLFGRNDLADYQLALFTDDPDLHAAELIFVMDDPSVVHEFKQRCTDLQRMHGLAFTLAYPGDNLGFAGATNHGAALARAPLLLLLNSDVMPKQRGWLSRMIETYRRYPDTGLLGAKLLYEDGSLQHGGMKSVQNEAWHGMWINEHPMKGLSPDPLTGVHNVPAVTAACAMVELDLYRRLGGLSEDYIIGDFEDSDLCYRASAAGRGCRIDLDVTLYHLERQSQDLGDAAWRTALTLYNCWVHDGRWGPMLLQA